MKTYVHISPSSSRNKKRLNKGCKENQNTHFIFHNFSENCTVHEICEKKNVVDPDRPQMAYNTANALGILDKYGLRHTLRICNTYCFYQKKTMDKPKHFNVT
jgi:hypothetical protein